MSGSNESSGRHLNLAHRHRQGWAVIEVAGRLTWPSAVRLIEYIPSSASAVLLDLTAVTSIDNTGIAVLANIAGELKHTGHRIHVVVADQQLRRQLPRTAGLQHIFTTIDEAVGSTAGAQGPLA